MNCCHKSNSPGVFLLWIMFLIHAIYPFFLFILSILSIYPLLLFTHEMNFDQRALLLWSSQRCLSRNNSRILFSRAENLTRKNPRIEEPRTPGPEKMALVREEAPNKKGLQKWLRQEVPQIEEHWMVILPVYSGSYLINVGRMDETSRVTIKKCDINVRKHMYENIDLVTIKFPENEYQETCVRKY